MRVSLLALLLGLLEVSPACIADVPAINLPLSFDFLVLSPLRTVQFDQVFPVAEQLRLDIFNLGDALLEFLSTSFELILENLEFLYDLS